MKTIFHESRGPNIFKLRDQLIGSTQKPTEGRPSKNQRCTDLNLIGNFDKENV